MSHIVHQTFTCMDSSSAFIADISALLFSFEDNMLPNNLTNHLVTVMGMGGLLVASLLPHGGSTGREWDRAWLKVRHQLKEIAVRNGAEWMELSFGGDHEGGPFLETNNHRLTSSEVKYG